MKPKYVRMARRTSQILALLAFLGLFIFATFAEPQRGLADLFTRLDPLVALTAMLAGRVFLGGMALAGITVALTLLFGRVWCGWLCPLGTTLDLIRPARKKGKERARQMPERLRVIKYVVLVFLLVAALLGNQTFLFLDPITLMTRTLAGAVWPALSYAVLQMEAFLYHFSFLWDGLDAIHIAIIYPLFRDARAVYSLALPMLLFFASIVGLNWLAERFWCRYACPLGGLLGVIARFSFFRREVGAPCSGCAACNRHCPTGTIDAKRGFASDPAECTVCYDCIDACHQGSSSFRAQIPKWKPAEGQAYDPSRREALGAMGAAVAMVAAAGVEPIQKRQPAVMIRPPGTNMVAFDDLCIRCGLCVRSCPTQGLQPAWVEDGWQNMLTPRLVPRLGACSYDCTACGEVCPTGAIPRLALEEKRAAPIGLARVDRDRCLPWAYNIDCIVCEEACPIGEKVIKLEQAEVVNGYGETVTIQRPYVVKERCIGCGICEYQCPMGGEAAIRVYTYTEAAGYGLTTGGACTSGGNRSAKAG